MIHTKDKINSITKREVEQILDSLLDIYCDFYITKNNFRLYIKENLPTIYTYIEAGDKLFYTLEGGIAILYGIADGADRIYLKLLAKDSIVADELIKYILNHTTYNLFAKVKKNNPVRYCLQRNGFELLNKENFNCSGRGKELLIVYKRS